MNGGDDGDIWDKRVDARVLSRFLNKILRNKAFLFKFSFGRLVTYLAYFGACTRGSYCVSSLTWAWLELREDLVTEFPSC